LPRGDVTASLSTALSGTLLTAPRRHSNDQNHKYDRGRDRDHDDAGAHRERDKDRAHVTPSSRPFPQHTPTTGTPDTAREIVQHLSRCQPCRAMSASQPDGVPSGLASRPEPSRL
jgi:hypothetical protein